MLQKTVAAGVVGVGAVNAFGGVSAATGDTLETLRAAGVVHTRSAVLARTGTAVPEDILTGQRLLDYLASDGLLREASLDALPALGSTGDDGTVLHLGEDGNRQVAFVVATPKGRLQVSFREHSVPAAYLFPKEGGNVIAYKPVDGTRYERYESKLEVSASDDVGTTACDPDSCSGCGCEPDWCFWATNTYDCLNCEGGQCVVTDRCGC